MFKLIPSVVKGSWVIKQAVGNTPVLLGKKLTTKYFRFVENLLIVIDSQFHHTLLHIEARNGVSEALYGRDVHKRCMVIYVQCHHS